MMNLELKLKSIEQLSYTEKVEIEQIVGRTIAEHKSNRSEINKLALESVTCLAVSEARASELANQGILKVTWNGFTGKNRKIRVDIDRNFAKSQYASQQMIQKLAEQNLLTFDLITAINNKLNTIITEAEEEINKIYETLIVFFKQTRSDIIQFESRIDKLEQNVNLLHWHNTIEYQMLEGIEYLQLQDIEKIVCLANDFYDLTNGRWSTADLMLLKSTMSEIGINVKGQITYREFFDYIIHKPILLSKLLGDISIEEAIHVEPHQASIIKGFEKYKLLQTAESYIVESVSSVSQNCERELIQMALLDNYLKAYAIFNMNRSVNIFDFMNELLLNLDIFFNTVLNGDIEVEENEKKIEELKTIIVLQNIMAKKYYWLPEEEN